MSETTLTMAVTGGNEYDPEAMMMVELRRGQDAPPVWYDAPNIYALETWERIQPSVLEVDPPSIIGTYGSLTEMRTAYDAGAKTIDYIETQYETSAEVELDEGAKGLKTELCNLEVNGEYRNTERAVQDYGSIILAAQGLATKMVAKTAVEQGVDPELMEEVTRTILDESVEELLSVEAIAQERVYSVERALFKLSELHIYAELLKDSLQQFEQCIEAPYTTDELAADTLMGVSCVQHNPRVKISRAVLRPALGELVELFERFGSTTLDGEELVSPDDLRQARIYAKYLENEVESPQP